MRRWQRWVGVGLAVTLVAGAGAGSWALSGPRRPTRTSPGEATAQPVKLVSYDSCSQLLDQVRSEALSELDDEGSGGPVDGTSLGGAVVGVDDPVVTPAISTPAALASPSASASDVAGSASGSTGSADAPDASTPGSSAPSFSTTNDQVAGVDEPDLAKTNGQLLVTLSQAADTLEVAGVSGTPVLEGSLDLSDLVDATGLFLVGQDAVVLGSAVSSPSSSPSAGSTGIGTSPGSAASVPPAPVAPAGNDPGAGDPGANNGVMVGPGDPVVPVASVVADTEVVVVDVSNPADPAVARSFSIDGSEVDARLIDGEIDVVVASAPTVPVVAPTNSSPSAAAAALSANQAAVENSGVGQWLPSVTNEPSETTTVPACTSAMHSVPASGNADTVPASGNTDTVTASDLDTIGIVPIDPSSDQPGPEATVVGDASAVYASTTTLYVAYSNSPSGTLPAPIPSTSSTDVDTVIDAFDLSNPSAPAYEGSGTVPGTLIGQYAMSEYDGDLQVATTVGTPTPAPQDGPAPSTLSDNRITVLSLQAGALVPVGDITGLGTGEAIYAVRFEGPLAYVVTFDQTDPLYVVDLSNPADPQLAGQVPLTGYSSFLEPLGNGLLLGVGQDVNGSLQTDGLQVSLFDVSNPADPILLSKDVVAGASSSAEQDPHALLYWAPDNLVVMPVDSASFVGATAWTVSGDSLGTAVEIAQPPTDGATQGPDIERALVVGDMLYTVSDSGILASALSSLDPVSWMPYS